jgi:hypothetical protein
VRKLRTQNSELRTQNKASTQMNADAADGRRLLKRGKTKGKGDKEKEKT